MKKTIKITLLHSQLHKFFKSKVVHTTIGRPNFVNKKTKVKAFGAKKEQHSNSCTIDNMIRFKSK